MDRERVFFPAPGGTIRQGIGVPFVACRGSHECWVSMLVLGGRQGREFLRVQEACVYRGPDVHVDLTKHVEHYEIILACCGGGTVESSVCQKQYACSTLGFSSCPRLI